jgi:hypothetical protein
MIASCSALIIGFDYAGLPKSASNRSRPARRDLLLMTGLIPLIIGIREAGAVCYGQCHATDGRDQIILTDRVMV